MPSLGQLWRVSSVGSHPGARHYGCRASTDYLYKGLRVLFLENETLRIGILIDKGTDIFQFQYKPLDVDFMWHSPLEILSGPGYITSPRESWTFIDSYEGGWQEIFPNGGPPYEGMGTVHGQHGEVWGLPWDVSFVTDEPEIVEVRLHVRTRRTPFFLEKRLRIRSGVSNLEIEERVVNEGGESVEFMWGHHVAFGQPFLDENCIISVPAGSAEVYEEQIENSRFRAGQPLPWPIMAAKDGSSIDASRVLAPGQNVHDMLFLKDLRDGWYALTNPSRKLGFALQWDHHVLPYVWYWAVSNGIGGYPWYKRTYNIALEPFSSIPAPLPKASARGTTLKLEPGEQMKLSMRAIVYSGLRTVTGVDRKGRVTGK